MVSGIEGVGEAVTGGMLARAVEPEAGEGGHTRESHCLNCGAELAGAFCHQCGQKGHVHRTIAAWWHDFLHSVLHLDGKFWRTLPMLAWRPGELTRDYIHGHRARYVSPLALFLFSVFLMFAVFSAVGGGISVDAPQVRAGLSEEARSAQDLVARLERERASFVAARRPTAALDEQLRDARGQASMLRTLSERGVARGAMIRLADDVPDWLRHAAEKAEANPGLLLYKLQANAYKFSWALIPISVPFLWLLLLHRGRYRRDYGAYDHLVFVTYSIAFMSLALIAFVLIRSIGIWTGLFAFLFLFVPPVHIYRQLRGAYSLSRFGAVWRTAALLLFAAVALIVFLLLLLALGLMG